MSTLNIPFVGLAHVERLDRVSWKVTKCEGQKCKLCAANRMELERLKVAQAFAFLGAKDGDSRTLLRATARALVASKPQLARKVRDTYKTISYYKGWYDSCD